MREHGVPVDHRTIFRRVQRYTPELEKHCQPLLKAINDSYRIDETSFRVKKHWLVCWALANAPNPHPALARRFTN
jgi:transposase-like protein